MPVEIPHAAFTNKDRMGLFIFIEDEVDVAQLKLDDIHIWPFVRHAIMERLIHWTPPKALSPVLHARYDELEQQVPNVPGWGGRVTDDPLTGLDFDALLARKPKEAGGIDSVFLCRSVETTIRFEGSSFNPLIDPYIDLIDGKHSFLKVEMGNENPRMDREDYYPTVRLPWWPRHILADEARSPAEVGRLLMTSGVERVRAVLDKYLPEFEFAWDKDLFEPLCSLLTYRLYFRRFLAGVRPRAAFLACYWYPIGMAFIHAAKDLDIPVIEIQHGGTSEFNHPYTHWRRFPTEGYKLLPDVFWCWGQREVDMYRRWHPVGCRVPLCLHGGNPSLMPAPYRKFLGPAEPVQQLIRAAQKFDKVVVAALGTEQYGDLHDMVYRAMRIAPDNWLWLIRGHPHYFHEKWPDIQRKLATILPGRYEMEATSTLPLPIVLQLADHVVGGLSGIWVDALAFGVRPTLVGDLIALEPPDFAGNDGYLIATTPEQIVQNVIDHPKSDPGRFRWFADISPGRGRRVMDALLG